jgi:hypothetical protein
MSIADGSGDNRPRRNDRDDTRGTGQSAGSARNRDDRGGSPRGSDRKHSSQGRVGSGWGAGRRDDRPGRNDDRDGDRRDRGGRSASGGAAGSSRGYGSGTRGGDGQRDDRGRPNRSGGFRSDSSRSGSSRSDGGRGYRGDDQDRRGTRPGDTAGRRDDRRPGDDRGERRWSGGGDDRREGRPGGYRADSGTRSQGDRPDRGSFRDGGRDSAARRDDRRRDDGPRPRTDDRGYRSGPTRGPRSDDGYRGGYRGRDDDTGRRPSDRSENRDDRGSYRPDNRGYRGSGQDATGRDSDRRDYRGGTRGGSGSDYRSGDRPRGYRAADSGTFREGAGRRYDAGDSRSRGYRSDRDSSADPGPRDRTSGYRGSRDDGARGGFDGPGRYRPREEGGRPERDRPGGYRDRDRDTQGRGYRRPDDANRGDNGYPRRRDERSWSDRGDDRRSRNTYPAAERRDDARRSADRPDERRGPGGRGERFARDERPDRRPARAGDDRRTSYRAAERHGSDRARDDRRSGSTEFAERRPGYRAEGRDRDADEVRVPAPALPDDVTAAELDAEVRRDLRGLQKETAETVARHLVAAGSLVDDDPVEALAHARYARYRASRIAAVREAAGIAAYHAGEWTEALGELRAARRMGGGPGHLAVMADIERALGRPERALDLARGPESRELGRAEAIELAIVAAGARRDLGELDAAVVGLQLPELDPARRDPWSARLFYAYADNLAAAGREPEAVQWFLHAADVDDAGETEAALRLAELTGEPLPDDEVEFAEENVAADIAATADTADEPEPEDDDLSVDAAAPVPDDEVSDDEAEPERAERADAADDTADIGPVAPSVSEAESVGDDLPSSAADPVVTDHAVADADAMDDSGVSDGPAER